MAASLGRGNVTATGTLSEEEGANFISSTSSSCATEGGCLGDAGLERHGEGWAAHPWSECRSDPQLGARFYLLGWFRLLCFFVVYITLEGHNECMICCWIIAEAYESEGWRVYAKGKGTAPYITSSSREKEDTRCQTSMPWLSAFAKGAMRTQEGRRKIRPTDEILAFLK